MNTNEAIPAKAATPSQGQVNSAASAGDKAPVANQGDQGKQNQQEASVTISTKEYRDLQRDKARYESFKKRLEFKNPDQNKPNDFSGEDPELVDLYRKEQEKSAKLERDYHKERVINRVRDILAKEEYKSLPKSTKDLILKNPAALSNADNFDESILDIEDFIREQVAELENLQTGQKGGLSQTKEPSGHEAPPVISTGTPAPANAEGLEDVSILTGNNRSRGILRNLIKQKQGVK